MKYKLLIFLIPFCIKIIYCIPVYKDILRNPDQLKEFYQVFRDKSLSEEDVLVLRAILSRSIMDLNADPCENFYQYACGNWNDLHPIPDDESEYYFLQLFQNNIYTLIKGLLDQLISDYSEPQPNEKDFYRKAVNFYSSCLDENMINSKGSSPLKELLNTYGDWIFPSNEVSQESGNSNTDFNDWIDTIVKLKELSLSVFLSLSVDERPEDSSYYTLSIDMGPLGSQNKEIYLDSNESENLQAYRTLIEDLLKLLDVEETKAVAIANDIIQFETKLAKILEDVYIPSPFTVQKLTEVYPRIDWYQLILKLLEKTDLDQQATVAIYISDYYSKLPEVFSETPSHVVNNYILWRIVQSYYTYLGGPFQDVQQKYDQKVLGILSKEPRWKTCLTFSVKYLGKVLSKLYLEAYFDEDIKENVLDVFGTIRGVFENNLHTNDWLDDKTKAEALHKLEKMTIEVGYPDLVLNETYLSEKYLNTNINSDTFFENIISFRQNTNRRSLEKVFQKSDKRWPEKPISVNAFFFNLQNRVYVTGAILQVPAYHKYYPKFLQYAGTGLTLGHELTHGFDSTGKNYDFQGNVVNWWTDEANKQFDIRKECFIEKFGNYTISGHAVKNPSLSVSENIADSGGLKTSFQAYNKWLESKNINEENQIENKEYLPGFNDWSVSQLFFLSYAQNWCEYVRPGQLSLKLQTDAHLPNELRIKGVLSNFKDFSEAFYCPVGSPMNPEKKCEIW